MVAAVVVYGCDLYLWTCLVVVPLLCWQMLALSLSTPLALRFRPMAGMLALYLGYTLGIFLAAMGFFNTHISIK